MTRGKATPRILISALIVDDQERVLVTRHGDAPGRGWHLPDGDPDFAETVHQAIKRSIRDDLGAEVDLIGPQPCVVTETINARRGVHYVALHYRAKVSTAIGERTAVEWRWADEDEARDLPLLLSTREALRKTLGWKL